MSVHTIDRYWRLARAVRHQRLAAGLAATYGAVLVGTVLITLSLVSMAVLVHDISVGNERSLASSPVISEKDSSSRFALSYAAIDDKPVTLIVIDGEEGKTPIPPGISRLPEPDEAYVSPQLREELTGSRAKLFGVVAGTIDRTALESPSERRVYMRPGPQASISSSFLPLARFGSPPEPSWAPRGAGHLYRAGLASSASMILLAVLVPGLVTVGIAVASGADDTRRSFRMLAGIGFSRQHFLGVDLLEHLPFTSIGALIVLIGLLPCLHWDLVLPFLDARYTAHDIRAITPLVLVLAGAVLSLGAIVSVRAIVRARIMRRRGTPARRRALQGVIASLVIFLLALAVAVPHFFPGHPLVAPVIMLIGITEAVLMWAPVAVVCSCLAGLCRSVASRRPAPTLLVIARMLNMTGARHSAVIGGVSAVVLIAGLMQLNASTMTGQIVSAQQNIDRYGSRVLELSGVSTEELPDEFLASLPPGTQLLALTGVASADSVSKALVGQCDALQAAGLTCPGEGNEEAHTAVEPYTAFIAGDGLVTVRQSDPRAQVTSMPLLVSQDATPLDVTALQTLTSTYLPGAVVRLHSGWTVSASRVMLYAHWAMFSCAIGGVGVLYALGVSITASTRRESQLIAPIGAVTGAVHLSGAATAAAVGVPVLLSGALSTIVYNILPLGMSAVIDDPYLPNWKASPTLTVGALALTALTALVTAGRAYRIARRDTLEWRPGR